MKRKAAASDPLGLFETRKEARQYRREQRRESRKNRQKSTYGRIRKKKDGTFVLFFRRSDGYVTKNSEGDLEYGVSAIDPFVGSNAPETSMLHSVASASSGLSTLGTLAGDVVYSGPNGFGTWLGRNGKLYRQDAAPGKSRPFYGNQHTGSQAQAAKLARPIKVGATVLGAVNYLAIIDDASTGRINAGQATAELGANTASTFGGVPGVLFGVGWEIGRVITETQGYQNYKQKKILPARERIFGY